MSFVASFDAGMTLVELDLDFLARRLASQNITVTVRALRDAAPSAWARYDAGVDAGGLHGRLWHDLIADHLAGATATPSQIAAAVDWLWSQQPTANLFRAPITDMVALARRLKAEGVRTVVVSNSEGRLAELLAEIGIADAFEAIVDSGRLGIEKPDPRIFAHAIAELGLPPGTTGVHIGDSLAADVGGALAAGWRAIWYGRRAEPRDDPRVGAARDATEVAAQLARLL